MNLAEIEMLSPHRSESSVQYRNGWKTSGSRPSTVQRYDWYKVLVPHSAHRYGRWLERFVSSDTALMRHISTRSEVLRLRSRLKRLTSLVAAAVEQQSDLLRYARDIFQDLFREICIICLICGDQPATRVGGPAFNGWQAQERALWTRRRF